MRRPSNNLRTVSRVSYRPRVSLQPTMVGRRQPQLLRDSGGNAGAAHAGKAVPPKSLAVSTKLNESLDGAAEGAVKGLAADTTQGHRYGDTPRRLASVKARTGRDTNASTAPESPCALPALRALWQAGSTLANSMPSPL